MNTTIDQNFESSIDRISETSTQDAERLTAPTTSKRNNINFIFDLKALKYSGIVWIFLGVFQVILGLQAFSSYPEGDGVSMVVYGLMNCLLIMISMYWVQTSLKKEEDPLQSFINITNSKATNFVATSSFVNVALSWVQVIRLYLTTNYAQDMADIYPEDPLYANGEDYDSAVKIFMLLSVMMAVYFSAMGYNSFRYLKDNVDHLSFTYQLFSAMLLVSSTYLAYQAKYAQGYDDYPQVKEYYHTDGLSYIIFFAFVGIFSSIFNWFVNNGKYRAGYFISGAVCLVSMFLLLLFASNSYSNTQRVYEGYSDTSSEMTWSNLMTIVNKKSIEAFGCPNKYQPIGSECLPQYMSNNWEEELPAGLQGQQCLNLECASKLGQMYAEPFVSVTVAAFLTVKCFMLCVLGAYFANQGLWLDCDRNQKKDRKWIYGMVAFFALSMFFYGGYKNEDYIQERTVNGVHIGPNDPFLSNAVLRPLAFNWQVYFEGSAESAIENIVTTSGYKYVILTYIDEIHSYRLREINMYQAGYNDFVKGLTEVTDAVGFIHLEVEDIKKLVQVMWLPDDCPQDIKDVYFDVWNPLNDEVDFSKAGWVTYIAHSEKDLDIRVMLPKIRQAFTVVSNDQFQLDFGEMAGLDGYGSDESVYNEKPFEVDDMSNISEDTITNIEHMRTNHSIKYIGNTMTENGLAPTEMSANTEYNYFDFLNYALSIRPERDALIVYDLEFENEHQVIVFAWNIHNLKGDEKDVFLRMAQAFQQLAIPVINANSIDYLDLADMMAIGTQTPAMRAKITEMSIQAITDVKDDD